MVSKVTLASLSLRRRTERTFLTRRCCVRDVYDRQVAVDNPDLKGRIEILKVHAKNKRFEGEVDIETIAKRTPGFSGADLSNLLNEAAILTGRRNKDSITLLEIDDSVDRIVAGMEGTRLTDGKAKTLVAYHEVGHAICGTLQAGHDPVQKSPSSREAKPRV